MPLKAEYLPYLKKGHTVTLDILAAPEESRSLGIFLMENAGLITKENAKYVLPQGKQYEVQEVEGNMLHLFDGWEGFWISHQFFRISKNLEGEIKDRMPSSYDHGLGLLARPGAEAQVAYIQ